MDSDSVIERARVGDYTSHERPDGFQARYQYLLLAISNIGFWRERAVPHRMRVREELMEPPPDFDKGIGKAKVFDIFPDV